MSGSKSSIRFPQAETGLIWHWAAILTGAKNTLKAAGFFLGGLLLYGIG